MNNLFTVNNFYLWYISNFTFYIIGYVTNLSDLIMIRNIQKLDASVPCGMLGFRCNEHIVNVDVAKVQFT